jgi:rubrerythrin
MKNEVRDLLDIAIDREIISEAFYLAAINKTEDTGARELLRELAVREAAHREWVKALKEKASIDPDWIPAKQRGLAIRPDLTIGHDLQIGEHLNDINLAEGASLQDVITAAMKREQYSVEFYTGMHDASGDTAVRQLCDQLIQEERSHKARLELFYEDFFLKEN